MTRNTQTSRRSVGRRHRRRVVLLALALVAATFAVYANSLRAAFVYDDRDTILWDKQLGDFSSLSHILLGVRGGPTGGRPLTSLSFNLNAVLAGHAPAGYRVVNIVIHAAAGLALFALMRLVLAAGTDRPEPPPDPTALAFAISLLWLIHPLQTESVTYVSQRAEALMGLFFLVAVYCAVRGFGAQQPGIWFRCAAAACMLSVLSKEVGVVAPMVILTYDRLFVSRSLRSALGRHARLYGGLAVSWAVAGALQLTGPRGSSVSFSTPGLSPWRYLQHQLVAVPEYLKLVFWPAPLVFDYGYPPPLPPLVDRLVGASLLIVLAAACVWGLRRFRLAGFAGLSFFLVLAPTSTVLPIITEVVAEHRMYLPLACVLGVVVGGLRQAARAVARRDLDVSTSAIRSAGWILLVAAGLALGALTWQRNRVYRNELSLWRDTVAKAPDNPRAQNNLGMALL